MHCWHWYIALYCQKSSLLPLLHRLVTTESLVWLHLTLTPFSVQPSLLISSLSEPVAIVTRCMCVCLSSHVKMGVYPHICICIPVPVGRYVCANADYKLVTGCCLTVSPIILNITDWGTTLLMTLAKIQKSQPSLHYHCRYCSLHLMTNWAQTSEGF